MPSERTPEKRTLKYHTDYTTLPSLDPIVLVIGRVAWEICFTSANQKHYPDLGSDMSSVWNFLRSFLRLHFTGKPVVALQNVGWFPVGYMLLWKLH